MTIVQIQGKLARSSSLQPLTIFLMCKKKVVARKWSKRSRRPACAKTAAVCALPVYSKFYNIVMFQLINSFDYVSDDTACLKKKSHSA